MMGEDRLAIFAGRGMLPQELYDANPDALIVSFHSVGIDFEPQNHFEAAFEKSGALFRYLRKAGIKRICFAGAIERPEFDRWRMDWRTWMLIPKLKKALAQSDGKALSFIRNLVESEGFVVVGAHELLPDLVAKAGKIGGIDVPAFDASRAKEIHEFMSALDIGQALVMRDNQCLAIETLPGTRAMLEFVSTQNGEGGYMFKSSKLGQDLDMDMASIGPDTILQAKKARLNGVALGAGHTMILEREKTIKTADEAGLFIVGI